MICDYLSGSNLCSLGKGNLILIPRRFHQTLLLILNMACGSVYHKAYAVNEPDFCLNSVLQAKFSRLFRNKFGLCGHDRLSAGTLRQFISGLIFQVLVFYGRKD